MALSSVMKLVQFLWQGGGSRLVALFLWIGMECVYHRTWDQLPFLKARSCGHAPTCANVGKSKWLLIGGLRHLYLFHILHTEFLVAGYRFDFWSWMIQTLPVKLWSLHVKFSCNVLYDFSIRVILILDDKLESGSFFWGVGEFIKEKFKCLICFNK